MKNPKNKRQFDRRQLYFYLNVYHSETGAHAGYLADISSHGIMLFSQTPMAENRQVGLRIDLEKEMGSGIFLELTARSVWCRKDHNPDFYIIGFSLTDLSQQEQDRVEYLMEKYGFNT